MYGYSFSINANAVSTWLVYWQQLTAYGIVIMVAKGPKSGPGLVWNTASYADILGHHVMILGLINYNQVISCISGITFACTGSCTGATRCYRGHALQVVRPIAPQHVLVRVALARLPVLATFQSRLLWKTLSDSRPLTVTGAVYYIRLQQRHK